MKTPRRLKQLGIGAGSLLLLALVMVVVGYLFAPHFYLTRAIFWGESDYKDLETFPARTVHNGPSVSHFDKVPADNPYASQIEAIGNRSTNGSLEFQYNPERRLRRRLVSERRRRDTSWQRIGDARRNML